MEAEPLNLSVPAREGRGAAGKSPSVVSNLSTLAAASRRHREGNPPPQHRLARLDLPPLVAVIVNELGPTLVMR